MVYLSTVKFMMIFVLATLASTVYAAAGDDDFLRARDAYGKKNSTALSQYVQTLNNQQYLLAPYAEYWLHTLNIEETDNQTVLDFINLHSDFPFADKLRGELLKKLAKNQDWTAFAAEIDQYHADDAAVACYAAEAKAMTGDLSLLEAAKPTLWMQAKEQPAECVSLYDRMQAAHILTESDMIARLRLSLADSRVSLAKSILKRINHDDDNQAKLLDKAYANPSVTLAKKGISFNNEVGRELNLFALNRLAKADSLQSLTAFEKVEHLLQPEQQSYFYGRLALYAAQRLEPQALSWFVQAKNTVLNKEQLAWYVRSALREKNWVEVLNAIAKMDAVQSEEGAWRYWKARALKAQEKNLDANILFAKLSTERHFYGWLAQEELEAVISSAPNTYKPNPEDVELLANNLAIQRVELLQNLAFRSEAKAEWNLAIKTFDDLELLTAAEYASRKKWYELSVNTADKTKETHNFDLRYPTPYRELMQYSSKEQGIDEAWVYGITRQESRFMHYARSNVGAAGLMQLMPATAKWIATKAGWRDYKSNMIHELETNIALGTYYLRYTLGLMSNQSVMATAAYNAGPSRAKKWVAETPLEGAIYAETIPFTETRLYVQRVMANAHLYTQRLGLKTMTLKQRLGTIPARYNDGALSLSQSGLNNQNASENSSAE